MQNPSLSTHEYLGCCGENKVADHVADNGYRRHCGIREMLRQAPTLLDVLASVEIATENDKDVLQADRVPGEVFLCTCGRAWWAS